MKLNQYRQVSLLIRQGSGARRFKANSFCQHGHTREVARQTREWARELTIQHLFDKRLGSRVKVENNIFPKTESYSKEFFEMDANRPEAAKSGRTFDSAYSFSFSIAIGLLLFLAGLVISLTLGQSATIGLIFGVPLLLAGLVLPIFMMRDLFHRNEVKGECPYCSTSITTSDATIRLNCPVCKRLIEVRENTLKPGELQ